MTTAYGYDGSGQLVLAGAAGYGYDGNGNRALDGYAPGPNNELTAGAGWTYQYDNEGNVLVKTSQATGETWTYSYDDANRLTQAVHAGGTLGAVTVTEKYDVFGNRVEEDVTQGGGTTVSRFAYDAAGQAWADLDGSNALLARHLYLDGASAPFARITAAGAVSWYLTDHLGSVRALTDSTGAVIDQLSYDAFGNIVSESVPSSGDRFKYAGYVWQATLGLYGIDWRYYDPASGRWLQQDPLGLDAGPNPYEYASNQPTDRTDPSGLVDWNFYIFDVPRAVAEGLRNGSRNVGRGAGKFVAETVKTGYDLGRAGVQAGSLLLDQGFGTGLPFDKGFGTGVYMYEPSSAMFRGMDAAAKRGEGGAYIRQQMANGASLGLKPLAESAQYAIRTGDWDQFGEAAGSFAMGAAALKLAEAQAAAPGKGAPAAPRGAVAEESAVRAAAVETAVPRSGPTLWKNLGRNPVAQEVAAAEALGVRPIKITGPSSLAEIGKDGRVFKWVVSEEGELIGLPKVMPGDVIKHSVATGGRPVQAAGNGRLQGNRVLIDKRSGHYQPDPRTPSPNAPSLRIAKEKFEAAGFQVEIVEGVE